MPHRILIVDDDEAYRDAMGLLLAIVGYIVDTAVDGAVALESVGRQTFDLLILDCDLPGMDGVELFNRIRQVQPEIRGILVSGDLTDARRTAAKEAGMLDAFRKLNSPNELLSLIAVNCRAE